MVKKGSPGGIVFLPMFLVMAAFPVAFAAAAAEKIAGLMSPAISDMTGISVAILAAAYLGKKIVRG